MCIVVLGRGEIVGFVIFYGVQKILLRFWLFVSQRLTRESRIDSFCTVTSISFWRRAVSYVLKSTIPISLKCATIKK